jgi:predicted hydrolase (HD superfamily)
MSEFRAERAEELLREWTKSESLVKHCLAVAACT